MWCFFSVVKGLRPTFFPYQSSVIKSIVGCTPYSGIASTGDHLLQYVPHNRCAAHPCVLQQQIRQYFKDDTFYVTDLEDRGLCDDDITTTTFACTEFDPSAATVKVTLKYPSPLSSTVDDTNLRAIY